MPTQKDQPMPPRVLVLTNLPAPYRLPVFEVLGQQVDLTVAFCEADDPQRQWQVDLHSQYVSYQVFSPRPLNLLNRITFVFNPDLHGWLKSDQFDAYIAGENFVNAPSVITVMRMARRRNKPFILWSENIDTAYASGTFLSNAYRRWLYRHADGFLAYSDMARDYLIRRGCDPAIIVRGWQVVPPEQIPAPRPRPDFDWLPPADGITVAFVGSLDTRQRGAGFGGRLSNRRPPTRSAADHGCGAVGCGSERPRPA